MEKKELEEQNKIIAPITHETFAIGLDKYGNIVFLKSYSYLSQKEEALSDIKWVQENCANYHFGAMTEFKLSHIEHDEIVSTHKIVIPHP